MTIEKLKSGSYRIKQMVDGVTYRVTVDHKPTDKEAERLITEKMAEGGRVSHKTTLKSACEAYIDAKDNLLSISTIRGYRGIIRQINADLLKMDISHISKPIIQAEINRYAADHSPKSTRNFGMFITTVMNFYGYKIDNIQYPQKIKPDLYIPTVEEMKAILDYLYGTPYYIPVFLGCRGLRLSEVCALKIDDLSTDNILSINKAKVRAEDTYYIKSTKTTESTRKVAIPDEIADMIRKQGYIYEGYPNVITQNLERAEKKLGIKHFSFHQLRHFFASYVHYQGFADKALQEDGGWVSSYILDKTYKQAMDKEKNSRAISNILTALL